MKEKTSAYLFIGQIASILVFSYLFLFQISLYDSISLEDHLVEYLSAIALAGASVYLFKSSRFQFSKTKAYTWQNALLFIMAIILFIGAGEEISWGQRIFEIQTPESLIAINDQNELNFHNVNKKLFDRLLDWVTILFVLISSVLYISNKRILEGIRLPDIYIICAFALCPFYHQYNSLHFDYYHLIYLALFALLIYAIKSKSLKALYTVSLSIATTILIVIIHTKYNHLFPSHKNSANEYRELLFCTCCLFYAYHIYGGTKKSLNT